MKITLQDWGSRNYSPAPSMHILRAWANSGQIIPAPEKVGKSWMVDEKAVRVPLAEPLAQPSGNVVTLSSRAKEILRAA